MRTQRQRRLKQTAGSPPRQMHDVSVPETVEHVLQGIDDVHVLVGPLLWRPPDGLRSRFWYFVVATSESGRGFRCDQINIPEGDSTIGEIRRSQFLMALMQRRPLVIPDCGDEVQMARLCEVLWPSEQTSRIRVAVEAERAEWAQAEARDKSLILLRLGPLGGKF